MTDQKTRYDGGGVNVGGVERLVSFLLGGAMTIKAARKGGFLRTLAGGYLLWRGATGHCGVYRAAGISTGEGRGVEIEEAVTINRPLAEVWGFWRNLENLPEFMEHLAEVKVIDSKRSHWVAEAPGDIRVEWDAEIVGERVNEFIAWRSLPYSDIRTRGRVDFRAAPGLRGTEVRVRMFYDLPGVSPAAAVRRLVENITFRQLRGELLRLKEQMETPGRRPRAAGE